MGHRDRAEDGETSPSLGLRGDVEVLARVDGRTGALSETGALAALTDWPEGRLEHADVFRLLDVPSVPELVAVLGRVLDEPAGARPVRLRLLRGDGRWADLPLLVWNEGTPADPAVVLLSDPAAPAVGVRRRTETVLARGAYFAHLEEAVRQVRAPALVAIRLDDLDTIGAALGADAGDQLFAQSVERIRRSAECDEVVAALGSTVLAVLAADVPDRAAGHRLARALQDLLCLPFELGETEVFAAPRIAVGLPGSNTDVQGLLWATVTALDRVATGSPVTVVDAVHRDTAREVLELRQHLHRSIESGQLRLHYQPVIDLAHGNVCGVEALVRWQHPDRGLLMPAAFLSIAEESNFVGPLGRWVLWEACRQATAWVGLPQLENLQLAVNVSPNQLLDDNFVDDVADALGASGLEPGHLLLEVTETALLETGGHVDVVFARLVDLGVALAVDDFGTGHASLEHLRSIPATVVKIDRTFVAGYPDRAEDTAIVEGTISLIHSMGRIAVAEGVETVRQLDLLRDRGCDQAQGYVISRPLPPEQFQALFGGEIDLRDRVLSIDD